MIYIPFIYQTPPLNKMHRIINRKTLSPYCKEHVDTINTLLARLDTTARMTELVIYNGSDCAIIASVFTADTPEFGQIFYSYSYEVSVDGSTTNFIGSTDDLGSLPEQLNYDEKFRTWFQLVSEQILRKRGAYILSNKIKKELVAAVWHPRRVARWLEEGGWDAVEAM